jgi:hypothetical protein
MQTMESAIVGTLSWIGRMTTTAGRADRRVKQFGGDALRILRKMAEAHSFNVLWMHSALGVDHECDDVVLSGPVTLSRGECDHHQCMISHSHMLTHPFQDAEPFTRSHTTLVRITQRELVFGLRLVPKSSWSSTNQSVGQAVRASE